MKFRSVIQLWIVGLIFLASAFVYAEDENILTVTPPAGGGPGIYEITISGTRDSDTATVREYTTDIRTMYCHIGEAGCVPSVTVKATIEKGQNPGRSTYLKKFRLLLEESMYYFSFLLQGEGADGNYDKEGKVIMPSSYEYTGFSGLLVGSGRPPVNVSLQNATAEITGTDSFTLRNLGAELSSGEKFNAWGKFRWNPDTLSFELKDAGLQ